MTEPKLDQAFLDGMAGYAGAAPSAERDVLKEMLSGGEDDQDAVELNDGELLELSTEFTSVAALERRKEALEEQLSDVSALLLAARFRMGDAMKAQGTTQFRGDAGESCFFQTQFDTQVDDPQAFLEWAQERHPELLGINAQTRTSFIRKNYRDKGISPDSPDFPPGITVTERDRLQVRGVKKKKKKGTK